MARQEIVSQIFDLLVSSTNKPYVKCKDLLKIIDTEVPTWKDLFNAPWVYLLRDVDSLAPETISKLMSPVRYVSADDTEAIESIREAWNIRSVDMLKEFKKLYTLKKIKPTDSIYDTYKGILDNKTVCKIYQDTIEDADISTYKYAINRVCNSFGGIRSNPINSLGFFLYSLEMLPDFYVSVTKVIHDMHQFVLYKKEKNLKLESDSVSALSLIDNATNCGRFTTIFHIPNINRDLDLDILGKLHTASYAHDSFTMLNEVFQVIQSSKENIDKFNSLVGLGRASYANRMTQLYLMDVSIEEIHNWYWGKSFTEQDRLDAIDILEQRYQSYKASQAKKKDKKK